MKKCLKLLLVFAIALTCLACEKKVKPFDLPDKYYEESKVEELDLDGLNKLIDDKESFGLYVFLPGCSACSDFKKVLDEFQKDNKLTFYSTEIANAHKTELKEKFKYAPSFVIYKEGKIVAYLDYASDKDKKYYKNVDNFKEWLTKYINLK